MSITEFITRVKARSELGFQAYSDFTSLPVTRGEFYLVEAPDRHNVRPVTPVPVPDGFFAILRENDEIIFITDSDLVQAPVISGSNFSAIVRLSETRDTHKMGINITDMVAFVEVCASGEALEKSDAWARATHGVDTEHYLKGIIAGNRIEGEDALANMMRNVGIPEELLKDLGLDF